MNKYILAALAVLVAIQATDGQLIIVVLYSLWSFFGMTPNINFSPNDLAAYPNFTTSSSTSISISTTTKTTLALVNKNLGQQATITSNSMTMINTTVAVYNDANSISQMSTFSSGTSETIIFLYEESQTRINYLLLYIEAVCVGHRPTGSPVMVEGFDPTYPTPTSVNTVAYQAQAVISFTTTISQEIANYCSQYTNASAQVNNNCTCPTQLQCEQVIQRWSQVNVTVSVYQSMQLTNTTLIRHMNVTASTTLIEAINATNTLLAQQKTCTDCLTSGCRKNKVKAVTQCGASKSKSSCRDKASKSAKRVKSNQSRRRKCKKKKERGGQQKMQKNVNNRWGGVWSTTGQMSYNFYRNITATTSTGNLLISNYYVRNDMINYYYAFFNYSSSAQAISNDVTITAENCSAQANTDIEVVIKNATDYYFNETFTFSLQVTDDNVTECFNASDKSFELLAQFANEIGNCEKQPMAIIRQIYVNISSSYLYMTQGVNYYSYAHDQCVRAYCPFLSLTVLSPWICFALKRTLTGLYDTPSSIDAYRGCSQRYQQEMINATGQISYSRNTTIVQVLHDCSLAVEVAQQCADATVAKYMEQLNQLKAEYQQCLSKTSTTTTTTTSTTSTTTTTTSTTPSTTTSTTEAVTCPPPIPCDCPTTTTAEPFDSAPCPTCSWWRELQLNATTGPTNLALVTLSNCYCSSGAAPIPHNGNTYHMCCK